SERVQTFEAAAKSQSGKKPSRRKAGGDPLEELRSGTDFAFSQLEESYRQRRRVTAELESVKKRLAQLDKDGESVLLRVWLREPAGAVRISSVNSGRRLQSRYELRLEPQQGVLLLLAPVTAPPTGERHFAILAPISSLVTPMPRELHGGRQELASYPLPSPSSSPPATLFPDMTITFRCLADQPLPAGDVSWFWQGGYLGTTPFTGCLPGESHTFSKYGR
ncbi:MAG TPA: hypothetical protein VFR01_02095, partial [Geobacterales bacterium]|nr:hypothetical protein [Geobacterales bacterium]